MAQSVLLTHKLCYLYSHPYFAQRKRCLRLLFKALPQRLLPGLFSLGLWACFWMGSSVSSHTLYAPAQHPTCSKNGIDCNLSRKTEAPEWSLPDGPTYIPVPVSPSSSGLLHELPPDPTCKRESTVALLEVCDSTEGPRHPSLCWF